MAWENCKVCGKLRKVDIVISSDGWHQPACHECGDPEYIEPLTEPETDQRFIFAPGAFKDQVNVPVSMGGLGGPVIGKAHVYPDGTMDIEIFPKDEDG